MTNKPPADSERVPTLNGRPTLLKALNTGVPEALEKAGQGRWQRLVGAYRKLNLIMAGMYTGVGCSGVPHSHHTYGTKTSPKPESGDNQ